MPTPEEQQVEDEANHFARELLMPEDLVRREVRKVGGIDLLDDSDKRLAIVAARFGVSKTVLAFRLGEIYATGPKDQR